MKITINDKEVCSLSDTQKKVLMNDIEEEIFDSDIERRVHYIVMHKYDQCLDRLKKEWMPKLKERVDSIPTSDEALAELIFSQKDYKSKSVRMEEEAARQKEEIQRQLEALKV